MNIINGDKMAAIEAVRYLLSGEVVTTTSRMRFLYINKRMQEQGSYLKLTTRFSKEGVLYYMYPQIKKRTQQVSAIQRKY